MDESTSNEMLFAPREFQQSQELNLSTEYPKKPPLIQDIFNLSEEIKNNKNVSLATAFSFGIPAQYITWRVLRDGVENKTINPETLISLSKIFPPLSHSSNMDISFISMGITAISGDLLSNLVKNPQAKKTIKNGIGILGAISTAAFQIYLESHEKFGNTMDPGDALWGIFAIAPSYFAIRYLFNHKSTVENSPIIIHPLNSNRTVSVDSEIDTL